MKNLSLSTFDKLYVRLRSAVSSYKGASFNLKTFADGSAVVNVVISYSNRSVTYSCLLVVIYDDSESDVISCRLVDDKKIQEFESIEQSVSAIKNTIVKTRTYLSRIKN